MHPMDLMALTAFLHVSFMQFASVRFLSKLQDDALTKTIFHVVSSWKGDNKFVYRRIV